MRTTYRITHLERISQAPCIIFTSPTSNPFCSIASETHSLTLPIHSDFQDRHNQLKLCEIFFRFASQLFFCYGFVTRELFVDLLITIP